MKVGPGNVFPLLYSQGLAQSLALENFIQTSALSQTIMAVRPEVSCPISLSFCFTI